MGHVLSYMSAQRTIKKRQSRLAEDIPPSPTTGVDKQGGRTMLYKRTITQRLLAILLAITMMIGLIPQSAFAESSGGGNWL